MSSSHPFAIMSLQGLEENYHEVCDNYLSHSEISAIVSGKGSLLTVLLYPGLHRDVQLSRYFTGTCFRRKTLTPATPRIIPPPSTGFLSLHPLPTTTPALMLAYCHSTYPVHYRLKYVTLNISINDSFRIVINTKTHVSEIMWL